MFYFMIYKIRTNRHFNDSMLIITIINIIVGDCHEPEISGNF